MWSPYHSSLPASAFVEKNGEALLSRLARAVGEGTSITSVENYYNTFVTLRYQHPGTRKPLTSSHITRETARAVSMHLTWLLACIHAGNVPFVKKMAARPRLGAWVANTLQATLDWPAEPSFPPCLNTPVADASFLYGAYCSLDVLFFLVRQG